MKEVRIEMPYYAERDVDVDTIIKLAIQYDLEFESSTFPRMTVTDIEANDVIMESTGNQIISVYTMNNDDGLEKFLNELKKWITP